MTRSSAVVGPVAGIEIAGSELRIVLMVATPGLAPEQKFATRVRLSAAGATPGANLKMTMDTIAGILSTNRVAQISMIGADKNSGVPRVKLETLVELLAHQLRIPTELVAIKTVNTYAAKRTDPPMTSLLGKDFQRAATAALRTLGQ